MAREGAKQERHWKETFSCAPNQTVITSTAGCANPKSSHALAVPVMQTEASEFMSVPADHGVLCIVLLRAQRTNKQWRIVRGCQKGSSQLGGKGFSRVQGPDVEESFLNVQASCSKG